MTHSVSTSPTRPSFFLAILPILGLAILAGWMSFWNARQRDVLEAWAHDQEARRLVDSLIQAAGGRPRDLITDAELLSGLLEQYPNVVALGVRNASGWIHPPVGSQAARLTTAVPPLQAQDLEPGLTWVRAPLRSGPPEGAGREGRGRGPRWARERSPEPPLARSTQEMTSPGNPTRPGGGPYEMAVVFTREDEVPGWAFSLQMIVWPGAWLLVSGLWLWNLGVQGQMSRLQEERRREAHLAAVGQMTARLAHEIKNPLGAIRGAAQHLLGQCAATDPGRALLQVVEGETHRLEDLTRGILDFSRPVQIRPERQLPGPFLRDALDRFATLHQKPPIPLDLPGSFPEVAFDGPALRQILDNLLANAFDACPDGPVTCSVVAGERAMVVRVSDRGSGLEGGVRDRLFEPFVSTKVRGYGLGLAISRRLAEAHGGRLHLADQPGGGCLAELELPLEGTHVGAA